MKKIYIFFRTLFILIIFTLLTLYILLNSTYTIKKAFEYFATPLGFNYKKIEGNIFEGITINTLLYKNKIVAKEINFRYNPIPLLYKELYIKNINFRELNIKEIENISNSFNSQKEEKEEKEKKNNSLPINIKIKNLSISTLAFKKESIKFNYINLLAKNIEYKKSTPTVKKVILKIDTNLTKLGFQASLKENNLTLKNVEVLSLNILFLEEIINKNSKEDNKTKIEDKNSSTSLKLPKINIKNIYIKPLNRNYLGVKIDNLDIKGKNIVFKDKLLNSNIKIILDTNLTKLKLNADISEEKITINNLDIKELNSLFLEQIINKNSKDKNNTKENSNSKETKLPIIEIKKASIEPLKITHPPIKIEKDTKIEIDNLIFKNNLLNGKIKIKIDTNLTKISYNPNIKDSILKGDIFINPKEAFIKSQKLPPIKKIYLNSIISQKDVEIKINNSFKDILKEQNITIKEFNSILKYNFKSSKLKAFTKANIKAPNISNLYLKTNLTYQKELFYNGLITIPKVDIKEVNSILDNLKIDFKGTQKELNAKIDAINLKGDLDLREFKKGTLFLENKREIELNKIVVLPKEINNTKLDIKISMLIETLNPNIKITSNLINIDSKIDTKPNIFINSTINIPKKSLLYKLEPNLKWRKLSPIKTTQKIKEDNLNFYLKADKIYLKGIYNLKNKNIKSKLLLDREKIDINGNLDKELIIKTKLKIEKVLKSLKIYYKEDLPKIKGFLNLNLNKKGENIKLNINSPLLKIVEDKKKPTILKKLSLEIEKQENKVTLNRYNLIFDKYKIFSKKPSNIYLKEGIKLNSFWINDQIETKGTYIKDIAKIETIAKNFYFKHPLITLKSNIDLKTNYDKNGTDINGKITLLNSRLNYDLNKKEFASDSDIIIVGKEKKEDSNFMDSLSTNIQIKTKRPLIYKKGAINIKADIDLGVYKAKKEDIIMLGTIMLKKGGSYTLKNKKFELSKSYIYFGGKANKPMLDIKVNYHSLNYLITISITGTPEIPNISFNSSPYLTREEILSLILFDSNELSGNKSSEEMMRMMGGAMAKSALNNLGVKIDHLVLGEGNSIEIGKKLTNKITIVYVNGMVDSVILKYKHKKNIESIIGANKESQSYDIIYTRDF